MILVLHPICAIVLHTDTRVKIAGFHVEMKPSQLLDCTRKTPQCQTNCHCLVLMSSKITIGTEAGHEEIGDSQCWVKSVLVGFATYCVIVTEFELETHVHKFVISIRQRPTGSIFL